MIKRQAVLIAKWQLVSFIHGIMNADNMALSGALIMVLAPSSMPMTRQRYFSSIDVQGRYAYGNQPHIAGWNLARFAETLWPLLHADQAQAVKLAQDGISDFTELNLCNWLAGISQN